MQVKYTSHAARSVFRRMSLMLKAVFGATPIVLCVVKAECVHWRRKLLDNRGRANLDGCEHIGKRRFIRIGCMMGRYAYISMHNLAN